MATGAVAGTAIVIADPVSDAETTFAKPAVRAGGVQKML